MRFTCYLHQNLNIVKLDEVLPIHSDTKLLVRNLDVFWNFQNVPTESSINYGTDIIFKPGYYSFEDIQKKLKSSDITLTLNTHDSTCSIYGEDHPIKLKSIAPLLGFTKDKIISADTATTSPQKVNINQDAKYLSIDCNLVNISQNFLDGKRSQSIATIPLTSTQRLHGTVSHFSDRFSKTPLYNGYFREIGLDVKTNDQNINILIEFEIV